MYTCIYVYMHGAFGTPYYLSPRVATCETARCAARRKDWRSCVPPAFVRVGMAGAGKAAALCALVNSNMSWRILASLSPLSASIRSTVRLLLLGIFYNKACFRTGPRCEDP